MSKFGLIFNGDEKSELDNPKKFIKETKCTCNACGNVWFYGKSDELGAKAADLRDTGKALMCCGGCWPAMFIPDAKKEIDINKCPKCNSAAIQKEEVSHEV